VIEKVATLREICESWSFLDVAKANALLDWRDECEKQAVENAKINSEGKRGR